MSFQRYSLPGVTPSVMQPPGKRRNAGLSAAMASTRSRRNLPYRHLGSPAPQASASMRLTQSRSITASEMAAGEVDRAVVDAAGCEMAGAAVGTAAGVVAALQVWYLSARTASARTPSARCSPASPQSPTCPLPGTKPICSLPRPEAIPDSVHVRRTHPLEWAVSSVSYALAAAVLALDASASPGPPHDSSTQSVNAAPEALTTLTASVTTPATGRT